VVLGGDAGSGKSALALSIATRVLRSGKTVRFYSTEMRPERVIERIHAMEGKQSIDELRRGGHSTATEGHEVREAVGAMALPDVRLVEPGAAAASLTQEIGAAAGVSFVIVDNLQALVGDRATLSEDFASVVRQMKAAALRANCALLLLANCDVDRAMSPVARPRLADFGAHGAVQQHSDVVLALYREEMYDDARGIEGAAELHVLKNRHGATGYADLYFYKKWLRFEDMEEP
jgi:replicative DNA helicase